MELKMNFVAGIEHTLSGTDLPPLPETAVPAAIFPLEHERSAPCPKPVACLVNCERWLLLPRGTATTISKVAALGNGAGMS
jgi:hypothetical protein